MVTPDHTREMLLLVFLVPYFACFALSFFPAVAGVDIQEPPWFLPFLGSLVNVEGQYEPFQEC